MIAVAEQALAGLCQSWTNRAGTITTLIYLALLRPFRALILRPARRLPPMTPIPIGQSCRAFRHGRAAALTLLRRLNMAPGATLKLAAMRADPLKATPPTRPGPIDADFAHLLSSVVHRGFCILSGSTGPRRRRFWKRSSPMIGPPDRGLGRPAPPSGSGRPPRYAFFPSRDRQ